MISAVQFPVPAKQPEGAARTIDYVHPDPAYANSYSNALCLRSGTIRTPGDGRQNSGTKSLSDWDGESIGLLRCFGASDLSWWDYGPLATLRWRSAKGRTTSKNGPFDAWRVIAEMSTSAYPADASLNDMGFQLGQGGGGTFMLANNADGIGWQLADANTVQILARNSNGGGFARLSIPCDTTKLNRYEMRIAGATDLLDAHIEYWINDKQVSVSDPKFTSFTAAGTYVPHCVWNSGAIGFTPRIVNKSGQAFDNSLIIRLVRIIAASTYTDAVN